MVKLFNVNMPQITKWELKEKLSNLEQNYPNGKASLYWYYSEFLLRANRNPWYKKVLNEATITAIDGKGLHWSMWKIMQSALLPSIYGQKLVFLPVYLRIPLFLVLFFLQLVLNLLDGVWNLAIKKTNFTKITKNETILGRDFTYDILKICSLKGYRVMIVGGSNEDDEVSKGLIKKLYPNLDLILWTRKTTSLLMQDKPLAQVETQGKMFTPKPFLTTYNLFEMFPDLLDAKRVVIEQKPDVILTCIGGGSGKQEFFIDNLVKDKECQFKIATGLGAAIDHLGGGKKQTLPPKYMQKMGLEWLFRFFDQPYRRMRILDSIFTLYWWTTVEQFTKEVLESKDTQNTVINYLYQDDRILVSYSRSILPASIGMCLPTNPILKKLSIEESGINYLNKVYKIGLTPQNIHQVPQKGRQVSLPVSLMGFVKNKAIFTKHQYYINYLNIDKLQKIETLDYPKTRLLNKFVNIAKLKNQINPDQLQHLSSYLDRDCDKAQ
jgi:UDP-N-acetyl-D-mannosaminuronic acid transferase (WecB/TagA/CpsF family)